MLIFVRSRYILDISTFKDMNEIESKNIINPTFDRVKAEVPLDFTWWLKPVEGCLS